MPMIMMFLGAQQSGSPTRFLLKTKILTKTYLKLRIKIFLRISNLIKWTN